MQEKYPSRRLGIWPTLPPNVHFRKRSDWIPFPLDQQGCRIYARARHAIWNAFRALSLEEGDVVLVPAYHHGSEIEALLQAGLRIRYYEVSESLEPDAGELEGLLDTRVRALYLIHYLGFAQDAVHWRQWCDARGLLLIEDAAQAFLATRGDRPVGSVGHMGIFCLYKTYGIPDGGAVVSTVPPPAPALAAKNGLWGAFKRHFNWVAQRRGEIGFLHLHLSPLIHWWKKRGFKDHQEFDLQDPATPPSAVTTRLLPRLLCATTAERRRENYRFLLEHLGELVPRPFQSLPEGACPFAFPLEVPNAPAFLRCIRSRGVVGLLFWINAHPTLPVANFPRSRALRERVLALPVHQELSPSELRQIVAAVLQAYASHQALAPAG